MTKRIMILASERSGTNLLRVLLGNHRDISAPVAAHFFDAFKDHIDLYGDLSKPDHARKLVDHMIQLANHKYHDWGLKATADALVENYQVSSFEGAFDALHAEKAKTEGKSHYACKDNHLFKYTQYLNSLEQVKYLYLYRDPRDHVASWLRTPLFMHTPSDITRRWVREQARIDALKTNGLAVHAIKYEDLIASPVEVMSAALDFIGVEQDENCYSTQAENKESQRNEFWKNLSKPIMKNNAKKYLKSLSSRDILIVESLAKQPMQNLGYAFDTKANWKPYTGHSLELKWKRAMSKRKHRDLFNNKMADMQDKFDLINSFRKELQS